MPSDPCQIRLRHWLALTAIVILAAGLRVHRLAVPKISHDEMCSIESSTGRGPAHLFVPLNTIVSPPPNLVHLSGALPIWTIPAAMHRDVHPPLYFILLRIWEDVFGDGTAAIRALSVVAGVAAVVLIFDVGRLMNGAGTGLWAALLMTVAQPQITYSQNARPYAMAIAFSLAAADALFRTIRLGPARWRYFAFLVGILATCLTFYFAVPAAIAMGIYGMTCTSGRTRRGFVMSCLLAAVAATVLWVHAFWLQRAWFFNPAYFWYTDKAGGHVARIMEWTARLPIRYLGEPFASSSTLFAACGAGVLYLLPWLLGRRRPEFILLGLWLVSCAGSVSLLDLCRSTKLVSWIRYSLPAAPAVYLMLPMISRRAWLNCIIAAAAVIYCVMNLPQAYDIETLDFSHMAAEVDGRTTPGDILLIDSRQYDDYFAGGAYMGVQRLARHMPGSVVLLHSPVPRRLLDELAARSAGHHCFIIYWMGKAPEDRLPGWRVTQLAHYPFAGTFCELTPLADAHD